MRSLCVSLCSLVCVFLSSTIHFCGLHMSIMEKPLITGDPDPVSLPHISHSVNHKQSTPSKTSKSLTIHPDHSKPQAVFLSCCKLFHRC